MTPSPTRRSSAEITAVHRIGDHAPHSAFTDLVRHAGSWFCAFREGRTHLSADGVIRVLTSVDGRTWTSAAVIRQAGVDLRDPRFVVRPDGRLQLFGAAATGEADKTFQTVTWHSADGHAWGNPTPVGEPGVWVWRAVWHDEVMYGIGYATGEPRFARLYRSEDGVDLRTWVPTLFADGYPNESGLVFAPDGVALCLLRRDGVDASAQLGRATPPYREWTWTDLGVRVGGPTLLRLPDGRLLAGVRLHDGAVRTAICAVDPDRGGLTEVVALPSGGDTSYPGMVWHDDLLWVSYYSSHEGRTCVYLAEVRLTG
ncbi:sialidase family protein [Micromonospora sp. WMMD1120]|uniref:sialidase family protein n=1 Tax=Micromonospora sp. WMMD1120 TaxID=3016106 RepID=UPI002417A51F|nr:sialidase family protein [Micromonospora sp. WMMD1120]MDG4810254.1 sialidase family protein [Micromonospora sp. WMMD1120]